MMDESNKEDTEKQKPTRSTQKKGVATKNALTRKVGGSPQWTFPKNSLEDSIAVAKAIEEQNAGNPIKADALVRAVGFKKVNDWRYLDLLRSANQYGLVEGSGTTATVKLQQIGQDIVAPGSPADRQIALSRAFRNVDDFKKVEDFYKGKKLPEDEFFENTLVREFKIPRDRVKTFIEIFTKNLSYLHAFQADSEAEEIEEQQRKKN